MTSRALITLPPLHSVVTRDETPLWYRHYPVVQSNRIIILYHGSITHSVNVAPLARLLSYHQIADVYTPDIRGHGPHAKPRGDTQYLNQVEDDIVDFLKHVRRQHPHKQIILAGHSMGGGLALRFAASQQAGLIDACLALAPYLGPRAPINLMTAKPSWKMTLLQRLDDWGVTFLHRTRAISFNPPEHLQDGAETNAYSYRLLASCIMTQHHSWYIDRIDVPVLVLAGTGDQLFSAHRYAPLFAHKRHATVRLLTQQTHESIMTADESIQEIRRWLAFIGS